MGYLTTFTIYNDGAAQINPDKPENGDNIRQLAKIVYQASLDIPSRTGQYSGGIGYFSNMVEVQRTRHADDHTIYVHMGNCVTELNPYDKRTKDLFKNNPEFANKLLKFLKGEVLELIKLQREVKEK